MAPGVIAVSGVLFREGLFGVTLGGGVRGAGVEQVGDHPTYLRSRAAMARSSSVMTSG